MEFLKGDRYKEDDKGLNTEFILPDEDASKWFGLKQDKFIPDKQEFIIGELSKDYPQLKGIGFEPLMELCSRSQILAERLALANVDWQLRVKVPEYFKEYITKEELHSIEDQITYHKKQLSEIARKQKELSELYRAQLKELQKKTKIVLDDQRKQDLFDIVTMESKQLPLTIQMAITNYVPADSKTAITQKAYAREAFINYQIYLLKRLNADKTLTAERMISDNLPK